jgi:hypothetical protein
MRVQELIDILMGIDDKQAYISVAATKLGFEDSPLATDYYDIQDVAVDGKDVDIKCTSYK